MNAEICRSGLEKDFNSLKLEINAEIAIKQTVQIKLNTIKTNQYQEKNLQKSYF